MAAIHWYWIAGWFFTLFGLVGNTWVIFIIVKRRRLQTIANWFIFSLAVADLGVTCGCFPASMVCNVLVDSCKYNFIRLNFNIFFRTTSIFALITMIAERYIAIVHSLKYVRVFTSTRKTIIIIATSWGIPATFSVFRLTINLSSSELSVREKLKIDILYVLLLQVAPTILLVAAHLHILLIARKLSLQMKALIAQVRFNSATNSATITNVPKVGLKAFTVRMITMLDAVFVICYLTVIHIKICQIFELCVVSKGEMVTGNFFLLANSVLNPLMYAFLKDDIKRETKALFCRKHYVDHGSFRVTR